MAATQRRAQPLASFGNHLIYVDSNVFIYAVGRDHPLRLPAQQFFINAAANSEKLCISAEVLQEFLHVYLPVGRLDTLAAAWELATSACADIFPFEREDAELARALSITHPGLGGRDLVHFATAKRRGATRLQTYDRALAAAVLRR